MRYRGGLEKVRVCISRCLNDWVIEMLLAYFPIQGGEWRGNCEGWMELVGVSKKDRGGRVETELRYRRRQGTQSERTKTGTGGIEEAVGEVGGGFYNGEMLLCRDVTVGSGVERECK